MNGSKSLKGGRTVREGVSISGTTAADLERDGGGFLRGLEREMRGLSVVGILARHRLFRMCALAYCIQWLAFSRAVRRHNAERNRTMKKSNELRAIDIAAVQSRMLTGDKLEVKISDLQSAFRGTISH